MNPATNPKQSTPFPSGMVEFPYLTCDGGPHLILPASVGSRWQGVTSIANPLDPSTDYGRACAAIQSARMALIPVGGLQAMVLKDPPMSAWGKSPEGWIDIYCLETWSDQDLDSMIKRAVAAVATSEMTGTGKTVRLDAPGMILMYAGDRPGSVVYGEHAIAIAAGEYDVLEGNYKTAKEEVRIYRLRPSE